MRQAILSTIDNKWDPFTQEDQWRKFNQDHGYNCEGIVGSLAPTSDAFSEEKNCKIIEETIDDIIKYDPTNTFVKVVKNVSISTVKKGDTPYNG